MLSAGYPTFVFDNPKFNDGFLPCNISKLERKKKKVSYGIHAALFVLGYEIWIAGIVGSCVIYTLVPGFCTGDQASSFGPLTLR